MFIFHFQQVVKRKNKETQLRFSDTCAISEFREPLL